MSEPDYVDNLRLIKSLLIVTSLQKRKDIQASQLIRDFSDPIQWEPLENLMIDPEVWNYIKAHDYEPKLVFCHPDIIFSKPSTSLYYRCLCGLSVKAAKSYLFAIESIEENNPRAHLDRGKALKMARVYNTFTCSIIKNSTDWTLENGYRTIVATLGITIDGTMRNRIGAIAEERIRGLILEWLVDKELIEKPALHKQDLKDLTNEDVPRKFILKKNTTMEFSSEPDISFARDQSLLAVIEIKGGIDPAGALERYGAAQKSFQHAIQTSSRCKNFYLGAVFTPELDRRISEDRLVEKTFNVIEILDNPDKRGAFFNEIFHHALRLI